MTGFRAMLTRHGVTEQQWRVLRILSEDGQLEATELAKKASILAPSLTRIIKSLEERRLIIRGRIQSDGRRVLLSISDDGLALIREVAPERREVYREIERRYGRENTEQLLDMLETLIDRLS